MLVEVGKFTFLVDFVILEMKEDSKVPLILGRPFLHTLDVVIRVKQKQLNLGVGTERMIFNINSAMKHSYLNDDTYFSIDVIDEILEEDFNDLLDKGSKILHSIEGTLLEEEIFAEFDEFMAMISNENSDFEFDIEEPPSRKSTSIQTIKSKHLSKNLLRILNLNPFLIIWNMYYWKNPPSYIPGICLSFCKHKIQLLDDKKLVVQKRRFNPDMQEAVSKEIVKLLDFSIIYPIADTPWVIPIQCVPKKGGITVVTNKNNELVPTRTVTGWRVCIDYRKLNEATAKDHFPLLFMDQIMPKALISDRGTYFCNKIIERIMKRYGVNHHFSTSYHPQTSGQVENTNKALIQILKKTVKDNPTIWSRKLDDALWAFRTAYKTPTGTTPHKLIYVKNCRLPFEIKHRAYWALKNCNPDLIVAGKIRMFQLLKLDELRHQAYENSHLYKERTEVWHDKKLRIRKEFKQGNKVLLFHSKYKFKQPKLGSRWLGPHVVKHQYPSRYVELYGKDGKTFIVNGHRLKLYHKADNDPREALTILFPKE
nr:reverse transcriptase domain-containing protein [Tanacetum cinerariifolium]